MRTSLLAALFLLASLASYAAPERFTTIRVNIQEEKIELFLRDESGKPFNRFDRLAAANSRLRSTSSLPISEMIFAAPTRSIWTGSFPACIPSSCSEAISRSIWDRSSESFGNRRDRFGTALAAPGA